MTVRLRKSWLVPVAVLGVCLMPATSHAKLVIALKNGDPNDTLQFRTLENPTSALLFDTAAKQNEIRVTTDQSATLPSSGQSRIEATGTSFASVIFNPVSPLVAFDGFEANPNFDGLGGNFTVTAFDTLGNTFQQSFAIDNNNRFNITSDADQDIVKVVLTTSGPRITDVRQVRTAGLSVTAVPETSTLLSALVVVGMGGIAGWRRMRRGPVASDEIVDPAPSLN